MLKGVSSKLSKDHNPPGHPKDADHFLDWPSPSTKSHCPKSYDLKDDAVSIVIYMKDILDSLAVQTFLSTVQFSKESNMVINNVVLTYVNSSKSFDAHMANIETMMALRVLSVPVIAKPAESEWKAKLQGVHLANSEQVC